MNRAITNKKEYSESGVVGYMCSNVGDCFQIQPRPDRLYPDYTTKKGNKFTVLRFDPDKLSKRDEGSSGYESITEEGIFKMDDGSYAECNLIIMTKLAVITLKMSELTKVMSMKLVKVN
jgi:hypothetical protein